MAGNSARKWPVTLDATFIAGDAEDCYIDATGFRPEAVNGEDW